MSSYVPVAPEGDGSTSKDHGRCTQDAIAEFVRHPILREPYLIKFTPVVCFGFAFLIIFFSSHRRHAVEFVGNDELSIAMNDRAASTKSQGETLRVELGQLESAVSNGKQSLKDVQSAIETLKESYESEKGIVARLSSERFQLASDNDHLFAQLVEKKERLKQCERGLHQGQEMTELDKIKVDIDKFRELSQLHDVGKSSVHLHTLQKEIKTLRSILNKGDEDEYVVG
jgi:chromosome segregation ATPase